ncbi:MAG: hypothetical protein H6Q65_386 [Firmicutes bacterium]|nr:hypothetical protein [Bacillota bacterium]
MEKDFALLRKLGTETTNLQENEKNTLEMSCGRRKMYLCREY